MCSDDMQHSPPLMLSICISTFNRAAYIADTLGSIITQATDECEIVVVDGASADNTEQVVSEYARRFDRLRYVRQATNNGLDRDFDRAVELANGKYCWLMSDDDLLKPGALAAVLAALRLDLSLIIVNVEAKDFNMSCVETKRGLPIDTDRLYGPEDMDLLFIETRVLIMLISCVVIQRSIWLKREREKYFGSMFIHVAVIYQERLPGKTLVLAEPLVTYRIGNTPSPALARSFEIYSIQWPLLLSTLALSESIKIKEGSREDRRNCKFLLLWKAMGAYSIARYRLWIHPKPISRQEMLLPFVVALLPGLLVYAILVIYYSIVERNYRGSRILALRSSRYHASNWVIFNRNFYRAAALVLRRCRHRSN